MSSLQDMNTLYALAEGREGGREGGEGKEREGKEGG